MTASEFVPNVVRSTLKDIAEFLSCKGMLCIYFWGFIVAWFFSGVYRGNILVLFGVLTALLFVLAYIYVPAFFKFFKFWFSGRERSDAFEDAFETGKYKQRYNFNSKLSRSDLAQMIGVFGMIPLLFSCVIIGGNSFSKGYYAVINDEVLMPGNTISITHPFAPVTWVTPEQNIISKNLTAKTKDNVTVTATVEANLKLGEDREAILLFANRQEAIKKDIDSRLEDAFKKAIGGYSLDTVPNDLLVLSHLIHQESLDLLKGLPLVWNGEFSVSKPKLIFKQ